MQVGATPIRPVYRRPAAPVGGGWPAPAPNAPAGYYPPQQPQAYRPASLASSDLGKVARVAGAIAGLACAVPALSTFGPVGFVTTIVVALAGAWYAGRAVEAVDELMTGSIGGAARMASWAGGAWVAAQWIGRSQPGAFVGAALVWLGSWGAGKLFDWVWNGGR